MTLGVALGFMCDKKRPQLLPKKFKARCMQASNVLIGIIAIFFLQKQLPGLLFLFDFARGFWLSFLGAYLVQRAKNQWGN
jgi:hypothetical protein